MNSNKREKRIRRHNRVRAKVQGTANTPRLCVFRSNQHIYAQIIDDEKGKTIAQASDAEIKSKVKSQKFPPKADQPRAEKIKEGEQRTGKILRAFEVGKAVAQLAQERKIKKVVFDKGGYQYHGRVKALAEGAREGGLSF